MKKVILTGNGLSIGLNGAFSLENITKKFYKKLPDEHKKFIEHHMTRIEKGEYIQVDFEEAIASIEQVHESLDGYVEFLKTGEGKRFLESENLSLDELEAHLKTVKEIIMAYSASIVEIIDGNVRHRQIEEKLSGFTKWLSTHLEGNSEVDIFTLNFDLLLETILLNILGKNGFTDFHVPRGNWEGAEKFNFSPQENLLTFGQKNVRLHHLHGSLSSFKRMSDGKAFKLKTEAIRLNDFYSKLNTSECFPSIITGGYKSAKIQMSPFNFYYEKFKEKMINPEIICEELYIIGYSFRDTHINDAIKERLKWTRKKEGKILLSKHIIVDYQNTEEKQREFVQLVNNALELKTPANQLSIEKGNFIFEGADSIVTLLN